MAVNGSSVLLLVKDGATWRAVGEQTGLSIEESVNLIEVGHKQSATQKYVVGRKEGNISLEALYVPSDLAYQAIKNAFKSRSTVLVRRQESGTDIEECTCVIESMSTEFPDDDVATISVELKMNNDWGALGTGGV